MRSLSSWYARKKRASRKAEALRILGNKCAKCNDDKNYLELDHIDPATKTDKNDSYLVNSQENFLLELKKLQLLCIKCHKEKTRSELACKHSNIFRSPSGNCQACGKINTRRHRANKKLKALNA